MKAVHIVGATQFELGLHYAHLLRDTPPSIGDRVTLVDLGAKPELNGSSGVAISFNAEKERWRVLLDMQSTDSGMLLKAANLRVKPVYKIEGIEGPWLQDGDVHIIRGPFCVGPNGETVEAVSQHDDASFSMTFDGETLEAKLTEDGKKLHWSDGDTWYRPANTDLEPLVEVTLIGPELPEEYELDKLRRVANWPEPAVGVSCYRGRYERFRETYPGGDATVLSNPGLKNFFDWAPALHAMISSSRNSLCICTGVEPYSTGEWLGDALYDELILTSAGFGLVGELERNEHGCIVNEHPTCGWQLWAYSLIFQCPGKGVGKLQDWMWQAYYQARQVQRDLPRFRFRPRAPELRPALLDRKMEEPDTKLVDEDKSGKPSGNGRVSDDDEALYIAGIEWLAATVHAAWRHGSRKPLEAAAAAAGVAAAEEFADRSRSTPLPQGQEHVMAVGACELAAWLAFSSEGGSGAIAAAVAGTVSLFEVLVYEALWGRKTFNAMMVGHIVLSGCDAAQARGVTLQHGVASAVGQKAAECYEAIGGPNQPPLPIMTSEMRKLILSIAESAGIPADQRAEVVEAMVQNLDLSIPARGGREASLNISKKMHDAPIYDKEP